jgi:transposase
VSKFPIHCVQISHSLCPNFPFIVSIFKYPSKITMKRKLSNDTRRLIINAYNNQNSVEEIAILFECHKKTVQRIVDIYQSEGRVVGKPSGGCKRKILGDEHKRAIQSYVSEDCSISLERISSKLFQDFGIRVGKSTVHRTMGQFSYSFKRVTLIPERRNDEGTIETRYTYARDFLSLLSEHDGENIFFLDEAGFNVSMRAKSGWAPKGERAVHTVTNLRTRNISLCCTMSKNGAFHYRTQNFPYNSVSFGQYVDDLLRVFDGREMSGVVIVMDNVRFHHNREILESIRSRGHVVKFLPPYSPFLNPIENMFAQWKQMVRSGASQNEGELLRLIEGCFLEISGNHCANYYRHMLRMLNKCMNRETIVDE